MLPKPVQRISPSGRTVNYPSAAEAARQNPGTKRTLISRSARRGLEHGKFQWQYLENGAPEKEEASPALTEQELRDMCDIKTIVFRELQSLKRGMFWRDPDFVRRLQGKPGYRSVLESPEAAAFRGKSQGRVYWSHPESIIKMKEAGILI